MKDRPQWQELLFSKISSLLNDNEYAHSWLGELEKDDEGSILGICIAIDLDSKSLRPELIGSLIEAINDTADHPTAAFAHACATHPDREKFIFSSTHTTTSINRKYVRILSLYDFINYYVGPSYGRPLSPSNIEDVRRSLREDAGRELGDIDLWWSGNRDMVWVGDCNEIETICAEVREAGEPIAPALIDASGLAAKPPIQPGQATEFITIKYPSEFTIEVWKPTVLDGYSNEGFFLSQPGSETWGRTQSCSGTRKGCGERIHKKFKGLSDEFIADYRGHVPEITGSRKHLVAEARSRWQNGHATTAKERRNE